MGILDFDATKSPMNNRGNGGNGNRQDRPEADFYLNFGYPVTTTNDEGEEIDTFVSLASGIAVDTMSDFDTSRLNSPFMRNLRQAQNDLRSQIMEVAQTLEPGQSIIVLSDDKTGLQVELRRRKAAQAPTAIGDNPMAKKIAFGG